MRRIGHLLTFLAISFLLLYIAASILQQEPEYYDYVIFNDTTLVEASGKLYDTGAIMVELDWFCDLIGAEATKDGRKITINWGSRELNMKLYSKQATINGWPIRLSTASVYKDGRVFVNIRTFMDSMGIVFGPNEIAEPLYFSELDGHEYMYIYTPEYLIALKEAAQ